MPRNPVSPTALIICLSIVAILAAAVVVMLTARENTPEKGVAESYKNLRKKLDHESPFPKELTAEFMRIESCWMANGPVSDEQLRKLASAQERISAIEMVQSNITSQGLAYLKNKHVKAIKLEQIDLTPEFGPVLSSLHEVTCLNLSDQTATDDVFCGLSGMTQLEKLVVRGGSITSRGLECVARAAPNITYLDLEMCPSLDNSIVTPLKKFKHLRSLGISCTPIDQKGVLKIAREVNAIQHMALQRLNFTDVGLQMLPLDKFTHLDLCFTPLTDDCLKTLAKMKRLSKVDLVGCKDITPEGLKWLKSKKPNLDIAVVSKSKF
ncbi:MAG: hypothetical protein K2Z81_11890 [Cyanobacteria bacterium]|nr:hypothetical protein [Cyanobacteriota bacterium]